jgi:hypothetical protein
MFEGSDVGQLCCADPERKKTKFDIGWCLLIDETRR